MFGDVWAWAGQLRQHETNIGLDPSQIPVAVRDLCDDTAAQIGSGSKLAYSADELAVRFHHRLVLIHPFRNGNGRHARPATDLLVADLGAEPFTWGGAELTAPTDLRNRLAHLDTRPCATQTPLSTSRHRSSSRDAPTDHPLQPWTARRRAHAPPEFDLHMCATYNGHHPG